MCSKASIKKYPNGGDDGELDFLVRLVEADGAEAHGRHGAAVVQLQHLGHLATEIEAGKKRRKPETPPCALLSSNLCSLN